jgi:pyruvate formate lyase activating enzyme
MTFEQVLAEILADRIFYDDSGGGATFSGGEPLLQFGFLLPLLRACRAEGIHTAVDTCGFAEREQVLQLAEAADLVLYDLKFVDEAPHREFCGASHRCILENLRELSRASARVWIRIPVIPGVNDSPEEVARLAEFVAGLPRPHPVHLLPYHRTGIHKFERLDRSYRLNHVVPPSEEYMDAVSARFAAAGLSTKTGG